MPFPWVFPYWFESFQFNQSGERTIPKDERIKSGRSTKTVGEYRGRNKVYTGHGR